MKQPSDAERRCWIYGTWDFKWPHDYTISLAFQHLHPEHCPNEDTNALLDRAIARFQQLTDQWSPKGTALSLHWQDTGHRLPPPPLPNQAQSAAGEIEYKYDLLISFAPLPVLLPPDPQINGGEPRPVDTQTCELGCYAWRSDYGVPTLFVGPPKGDEQTPTQKLSDWLDNRQFAAACVHEFGHALGLAHEHQNPLYRGRGVELKTEQEIIRILEGDARFKHYPDDQIKEEITSEWPHLPYAGDKAVPFSDWRMPPKDVQLEGHTVMIHPGWTQFMTGAPCGPIAEEPTAPTAWDLEQLASMYPAKP